MALEVLGSSGTFKATGRVTFPEIFDSLATGPKIRVRVSLNKISGFSGQIWENPKNSGRVSSIFGVLYTLLGEIQQEHQGYPNRALSFIGFFLWSIGLHVIRSFGFFRDFQSSWKSHFFRNFCFFDHWGSFSFLRRTRGGFFSWYQHRILRCFIGHLDYINLFWRAWDFIKVIYQGVLTTKPLEDREFQFVYNIVYKEKNSSKLQLLSWIWKYVFAFFIMGNFFGKLFYALELK